MKNIVCIFVSVVLIMCVMLGCSTDTVQDNLWENALYSENTELGAGDKSLVLEVVAQDKAVTLVIKTDKDNLEEALLEHRLISGEKGPYGMYVKFVNGMEADYDKNQTYWSLTKNSEYMMTGVTDTKIEDGEKYEFTYTK
jgi:hypothetical protein